MSGIIGDVGSKSRIIKLDREHFRVTAFGNSWHEWNVHTSINDESGLNLYRYGKIYVAHLMLLRSGSTGTNIHETICTISSANMTLPKNNTIMGGEFNPVGGSGEDDRTVRAQFNTDGTFDLYFNNHVGSNTFVAGNFIGIDLG